MKKLSSILVLMLIALMLFVSCNNSTPTKEESVNSDEVKEATPEEKELFRTLLRASIGAISSKIQGNNIPNLELSDNTESATFTGASFENIVLFGTASMGNTLKLNLTDGTKYNGVAHKLDCEGTQGENDTIIVTKLILDGKTLKYSDPISLN